MGFLYAALFYYGILLKPGFEEYKPEIFLRELDEFRAPEGVDVKKWYREIEVDKHGAECLDAAWGDDPISIQWNRSYRMSGRCGACPFLAVRETVLRSDDRSAKFTLPDAPTAEWDRLIEGKGEAHGINCRGSTFQVRTPHPLEATFFYGVDLDRKDVRKFLGENASEDLVEETLRLDRKWKKNGDPIFIESLCGDNFAEVLHVVGIRAVRHAIPPHTDEVAFQLDFVNTARWDRLLRANCERYDIAWREPAFHLAAEVVT